MSRRRRGRQAAAIHSAWRRSFTVTDDILRLRNSRNKLGSGSVLPPSLIVASRLY